MASHEATRSKEVSPELRDRLHERADLRKARQINSAALKVPKSTEWRTFEKVNHHCSTPLIWEYGTDAEQKLKHT